MPFISKNRPDGRSILLGRLPTQVAGRTAHHPKGLWLKRKVTRPIRQLGSNLVDCGRCGKRYLVKSIFTPHHPGPSNPQPLQGPRHPLDRRPIRYSNQLVWRASRIGQRAKEIEDRSYPKLPPHHPDPLCGLMMERSEHEADSDPVKNCRDRSRCEVGVDAKRPQHIGTPGPACHSDITVLGHWHSGGRNNKSCSGRNIEGLGRTAASTAGVDEGTVRGHNPRTPGAHRAGKAGQLLLRLSFCREGDQNRRNQRIGSLGGEQKIEEASRFGLTQVFPLYQSAQVFSQHR